LTTSEGDVVHVELGISFLEDGKPPSFSRFRSPGEDRSSAIIWESIINVEDLLLTLEEHLELHDTRLGEIIVDEDILDSIGVLSYGRGCSNEPTITKTALMSTLRADTIGTPKLWVALHLGGSLESLDSILPPADGSGEVSATSFVGPVEHVGISTKGGIFVLRSRVFVLVPFRLGFSGVTEPLDRPGTFVTRVRGPGGHPCFVTG
jgi:hypothetical protein